MLLSALCYWKNHVIASMLLEESCYCQHVIASVLLETSCYCQRVIGNIRLLAVSFYCQYHVTISIIIVAIITWYIMLLPTSFYWQRDAIASFTLLPHHAVTSIMLLLVHGITTSFYWQYDAIASIRSLAVSSYCQYRVF